MEDHYLWWILKIFDFSIGFQRLRFLLSHVLRIIPRLLSGCVIFSSCCWNKKIPLNVKCSDTCNNKWKSENTRSKTYALFRQRHVLVVRSYQRSTSSRTHHSPATFLSRLIIIHRSIYLDIHISNVLNPNCKLVNTYSLRIRRTVNYLFYFIFQNRKSVSFCLSFNFDYPLLFIWLRMSPFNIFL